MSRHEEWFIWLFLWVCGCSDGSKEVLVVWRKLDLLACRRKEETFFWMSGLSEFIVFRALGEPEGE